MRVCDLAFESSLEKDSDVQVHKILRKFNIKLSELSAKIKFDRYVDFISYIQTSR